MQCRIGRVWLPWNWAFVLAAALFVGVLLGRALAPERLRAVAAEAGVVAALYGGWQLASELSLKHTAHAIDRGRWVWDAERTIHLPSETTVQHVLLPIPGVPQAANLYYLGFHVPVMGLFLVWCFLRHRDAYPAWRSRLALVTGGCLLIQVMLPLAPPRLIGTAGDGPVGIVDTGMRWGPTVYRAGGGGFADQLSSMPSLHVGWALVVAIGAMRVSRSRWRYLGPGHAVLTVLVVVVTGNHYWLDGLAAGALLLLLTPVQDAGSRAFARTRNRLVGSGSIVPEAPILEPDPAGVPATWPPRDLSLSCGRASSQSRGSAKQSDIETTEGEGSALRFRG
jgi:hypothetical protein